MWNPRLAVDIDVCMYSAGLSYWKMWFCCRPQLCLVNQCKYAQCCTISTV